ncbi:MAG: DNA internalization-related competence protein ComEC/Rec2 [Acetivibrio sp.]
MIFAGAFLILISLLVAIPKSPLDGTFETTVEGNLSGRVESLTQKENGVSVVLSKVSFCKEKEKESYALNKVLVYFSETEEENSFYQKNKICPGNRLLIKGTLSKFQLPRNPGEFNSYYYYNSKGISYQMLASSYKITDSRVNFPGAFFQNKKDKIRKTFETWLSKKDAGLVLAMFFGEKQGLDKDVKRLYQKNGMGHLLVVSGLHISLIGMGIYKGSLILFQRKKLAAVLGILSIFIYGFLTGFGISSSRAVIMTFLSFIAILMGRTYDMISATALSAAILLALHPLEIRNAGFLLSFGAILGIAVVYPELRSVFVIKKNKILESFLVSIAVQLVTLPILLSAFYEYPLYGIFISLLVLPLLSLLGGFVFSSAFVGCFSISFSAVFAGGIWIILKVYEAVGELFIQLPFAIQVTGKPQRSFYWCYYILLGITLLFSHFFSKKRVWILLVFLFFIPILPKNPGLQVTFLDVGQGDGIYIETKEGLKILMDGGSVSKKKLGEYTLEPFLKSQGCSQLDYAIFSHLDEDHVSGIYELMEQSKKGGIKIKEILLSEMVVKDQAYDTLCKESRRYKIPIHFIKQNGCLKKGKLRIYGIHPETIEKEDRNESSLILEIFYGKFSLLSMGDLGKRENEIVPFLKKKSYYILKAGHHGSKYATSEFFLQQVNPAYTIISCGERNRYGHPSEETLERLEEAESRILYTKTSGAIQFATDGEHAWIKTKMEL